MADQNWPVSGNSSCGGEVFDFGCLPVWKDALKAAPVSPLDVGILSAVIVVGGAALIAMVVTFFTWRVQRRRLRRKDPPEIRVSNALARVDDVDSGQVVLPDVEGLDMRLALDSDLLRRGWSSLTGQSSLTGFTPPIPPGSLKPEEQYYKKKMHSKDDVASRLSPKAKAYSSQVASSAPNSHSTRPNRLKVVVTNPKWPPPTTTSRKMKRTT